MCAILVPAVSCFALVTGSITTLVELGGMALDTAAERRHDVRTPVGDTVTAMEEHLLVVCAVVVPC